MDKVSIIGAGLAGVEAANFLLKHGISVDLYERRPKYPSPAHHSANFAELVCSNSLKSSSIEMASGLLKEEMRQMDSIVMEIADEVKVPSGNALSVDREAFSSKITAKIKSFPNLNVFIEDVASPKDGINIIATGPLTSEGMSHYLETQNGSQSLSFFDASAPLIEKDSINFDIAFLKSRYGEGDGNYINCPFTKEQYVKFYNELINAKIASLHDFDRQYFEGCLPVEIIAKREINALRYGPLKPVGLKDKDGKLPFAVAQLRQDNIANDCYGLVGFQTNLTYSEQKRVFQMIPGLENAKFIRYGLMHRNTYINSPKYLNDDLTLKSNKHVLIAGQLSGVEGYLESAVMGLFAGVFAYQMLKNEEIILPPLTTMSGSLRHYITHANYLNFAPMNANYSILYGAKKNNRKFIAERSLNDLKLWWSKVNK